ncbi:hypothetical protein V8C86DRAFT_2839976 [Haematococcus lacustris]
MKRKAHAHIERFCAACGCRVVGSDKAWELHCGGIRHRRNTLGPECISVFEALPVGPHNHQPTWATRDPVITRLASHSRTSQSCINGTDAISTCSESMSRQAACTSLHSQWLRQLPHHTGRGGSLIHRAAALITPDSLARAASQLCQAASLTPFPCRQGELAAVTAGTQRCHNGSCSSGDATLVGTPTQAVLLTSPAAVAGMALVCQQVQGLRELHISVPFWQGGSPEAAAGVAALCVLLQHLRSQPDLTRISLALTKTCLYAQLLQQRGPGGVCTPQLLALWAQLLRAFAELAQAHLGLREICLATPPGLVEPGQLAALQVAMAEGQGRAAARMAVLAGAHGRAGAHSHLRRLPQPLLERVLENAVPKTACRLKWELLTWMPGSLLDETAGNLNDEEGVAMADVMAAAQWLGAA